jgi:hypothetical protein
VNIAKLIASVLKDAAQLQNKQLASVIAGGIVAVVAAIAGVHLTVAEVAGWLALVGVAAATLEKNTQTTPKPTK